jgi:hypothetical protein
VAWRIARRQQNSRLRFLEGTVVLVIALIGLVGTALDLFTSIDLGAFRYVAWLCLVLTPVLVLFATPWFLIGIGRRMMDRQKPK